MPVLRIQDMVVPERHPRDSRYFSGRPPATPDILWLRRRARAARVFFGRGGVPESWTGRAEMPMPWASNRSTTSGPLWTPGALRLQFWTVRRPRFGLRPAALHAAGAAQGAAPTHTS